MACRELQVLFSAMFPALHFGHPAAKALLLPERHFLPAFFLFQPLLVLVLELVVPFL